MFRVKDTRGSEFFSSFPSVYEKIIQNSITAKKKGMRVSP